MRKLHLLLPASAMVLALSSCGGSGEHKSQGPIVLGDSANIVTESDPKYLEDMVPDLRLPEEMPAMPEEQPQQQETPRDITPATPVAAVQEKPADVEKPAAPEANGFKIDFGDVTVTLGGVNAREGNKNFKGSNSAGLTLNGNTFAGSGVTVSGGSVTRVQQRIQTGVIAKNGNTVLALHDLGTSSGSWQSLKGSNGQYAITGISNPEFNNKVTPAAIKNAVQRAAKSKRLSSKDQQQWQSTVKNVRAANQAPLDVVVKSVTWKVEGKDAKGKNFTKEIRLDVPF